MQIKVYHGCCGGGFKLIKQTKEYATLNKLDIQLTSTSNKTQMNELSDDEKKNIKKEAFVIVDGIKEKGSDWLNKINNTQLKQEIRIK